MPFAPFSEHHAQPGRRQALTIEISLGMLEVGMGQAIVQPAVVGEGHQASAVLIEPAGEDIPLASRILAVADAYDAMTTDRPYRKARTHQEAVAELRDCAGAQFDPSMVEAFLRVIAP